MPKILVIEDSKDLLRDIVEMLSLEGFEAVSAENGQAGVAMAKEHLPDLILCDIRMPIMNGYDVLDRVRADTRLLTTPFIFLTARTGHDEVRHGMQLGADDYLTKPFTAEELIAAIRSRLRRSAIVQDDTERQLDELRKSIALALPHELRTPLNAILGFSEILTTDLDRLQTSQIVEMAGHINKAANRLYQLVERYVIYTNLELLNTDHERIQVLRSGRTYYAMAIIDQQAREKARQHKREDDLELVLAENYGILAIDGENLTRIIQELADNAFKFSSPGTPVRIEASVEGEMLNLSIQDSGRGMSKEAIASIGAYMQFDRNFFEQQGIGFGLAIAQRMTRLHGGELHIDSVREEYTKIHLTLPFVSEVAV